MPQPKPPQQPNPSPSPEQPPSTSPPTSPAAVSGRASSAGSEFFADTGPAFDPSRAPEAPGVEEDELAPELLEGWREDTVRSLLVTQGNVTHALLKVGAEDAETWKQTEDDLHAIAPPMTRLLNRYDATRAAAAAGDEIALGAALVAYGTKNYTRRRRLLAAIAAQGPQPVTGVAADPDTGPEQDEEYQRVHMAPPALTPKGVR